MGRRGRSEGPSCPGADDEDDPGDGHRAAGGQRGAGAASKRRAGKLERLGKMGLAEIAGRTCQEASKWWDRVGDGRCRLPARPPGRPPSASSTSSTSAKRRPGRFFAGADG